MDTKLNGLRNIILTEIDLSGNTSKSIMFAIHSF